MADIRIKDLATTASTTASDDFLAVDGTTNGTRKLSAATPSFATSVTVPGVSGPTATNLTLAGGSTGASLVLGQGSSGSISLQPKGGGLVTVSDGGGGNWALISTVSSSSAGSSVYSASPAGTVTSSNPNWYIGHRFGAQGPLSIWTYNGGAHVANYLTITPSTGNLLIGTTTDGGQKLQVNGTASFAGAVTVNGDATFAGNVIVAQNKFSNFDGSGVARMGMQAVSVAPYSVRMLGSADAVNTRDFSFGYYTGDNAANTWNQKAAINSYTGAATFAGAVSVNSVTPSTGAGSGALQVAGGIYSGAASVFGGTGTFVGPLVVGAATSAVETAWTGSGYAGHISFPDTSQFSIYSEPNGSYRGGGMLSNIARVGSGWSFVNSATPGWRVGFGNGSLYDAFSIARTPATTYGEVTLFNLSNTGAATFAGAVAINNTVATAVAVASTHKVTMVIGGVTYYLLASNV